MSFHVHICFTNMFLSRNHPQCIGEKVGVWKLSKFVPSVMQLENGGIKVGTLVCLMLKSHRSSW